jgi:nitrate reductase delta subunit
MNRTLKALSALLSYPSTDLQAAAGEIGRLLADDRRLPGDLRAGLGLLTGELSEGDIYEIEERYTALFDRSRTLSLNLFEHVHGESRARGAAMVSLVETYRAAGFEPVTGELPDHLPVILEFLAHQPEAEAKGILADAAHILAALHERLKRRESAYAWAFAALLRLSGARADAAAVAALLAAPEDDPEDLEALDAVWEESQVTFGPDPDAGCPASREMLNKMAVPVTPAPAHAAE